jgi:hypothetical protein
MAEYHEIEKLHKVKDRIKIIYDFLEWALKEKNMGFGVPLSGDSRPEGPSPPCDNARLVAEYFKIDPDQLEEEQEALLEELRQNNLVKF